MVVGTGIQAFLRTVILWEGRRIKGKNKKDKIKHCRQTIWQHVSLRRQWFSCFNFLLYEVAMLIILRGFMSMSREFSKQKQSRNTSH